MQIESSAKLKSAARDVNLFYQENMNDTSDKRVKYPARDLSTVKGRLIQFLREKNITQTEFCKNLGVAPTYIGAMRKGLSPKKLAQVFQLYPDLNRDWLMFGEGEMFIEPDDEKSPAAPTDGYEVRMLPVEAFAGGLKNWSDSVSDYQCERIISPIPGVDFAIRISGDSMEPEFHDGSTILIKRINEKAFIPWGNPMVIDSENGVLVKLVYPLPDDEESIEARSLNPKYPPFSIPTSSIYGLYRVMGTIKLTSTY